MGVKGVSCVRGLISTDECERCSLDPLHPCTFPVDFLHITRNPGRGDGGRTEFTPSSLLDCDRRTVLSGKNDYYVDVDAAWNLQRGSIIHELVERNGDYPEGSVTELIRERRLSTTMQTKYGPQMFSGKPDLVVIKQVDEDGTAWCKIEDYKTTSITHDLTAARRSNQMQLNMYAYLVECSLYGGGERVVVDELEITYTDLKRVRRFNSMGYLYDRGKSLNSSSLVEVGDDLYEVTGRTGVTEFLPVTFHQGKPYERLALEPIDLLPIEEIEAWIVRRIEEKIEANTVLPEPLEPPSDWVCPYCPMQELCFGMAGKTIERRY